MDGDSRPEGRGAGTAPRKRFHVHVAVENLEASLRSYSELFTAEPVVRESDYAKWMLENPRVNFAISQRNEKTGIRLVASVAHQHKCCEPAITTVPIPAKRCCG